jgi:hypothetical protein
MFHELPNGSLPLFILNFGIITLLPKKKEGLVVLHETIHELHSNKLDGAILKVDFEKAYDKVKWLFPQQALQMKGFDSARC